MSRYSRHNEDDFRLPVGMTRVGYDADTQKYTFRDADGTYWTGRSGEAYGKLARGWDGGPLLRTTRTGSASTGSSGDSPKSPATDFKEILGGLERGSEDGKARSSALPFILLAPVLAFKSKLRARRGA